MFQFCTKIHVVIPSDNLINMLVRKDNTEGHSLSYRVVTLEAIAS